MNRTPEQAYNEQLTALEALIDDIRTGTNSYDRRNARFGRKPNWGHVADLAHYASQLREIADELHHRGEYAEEKTT